MFQTHIILPSRLKTIKEEGNSGVYEIEGLYPGYGHTLGNSLRRIILSSLPGVAVTSVKIPGVSHEFSTISGVKEDVITILLNLKKIRFRINTEGDQKVTLKIKGAKKITAADIKITGEVEILKGDEYICEITDKSKELEMDIYLSSGIGYVPRELLLDENMEVGRVALDAVFTPIRRVNYEVKNMRVGDRTDYNLLQIRVETDGTITAKDALEQSLKIMIDQMGAILNLKELSNTIIEENLRQVSMDKEVEEESQLEDEQEVSSEVLKTRVDSVDFSTRTENALTEAGIRTLGGLVQKNPKELLELNGFGEKSLEEVEKKLKEFGLELKK